MHITYDSARVLMCHHNTHHTMRPINNDMIGNSCNTCNPLRIVECRPRELVANNQDVWVGERLMAGNAGHTSEGSVAPTTYRCAVATCHRRSVASCFECELFCCERHLSAVSLLTATATICVYVCPTCLHLYRADPEIQPFLIHVATRFLVD